ncbi:MAG TPA: FecR domain-containing protein [Steroidobacteraceae bacterium]
MSFRKEFKDIDSQAAWWTTRLGSGEMSDADRDEFHEWLADPANARRLKAYTALVAVIQELPQPKTAILTALPTSHSWFPALGGVFAQPLRLAVAGACVAILAALGVWFNVPAVREYMTKTYATNIGERRKVVLPDGSVAQLNTQSRVRWVGTGKERSVALEKGEVLFDVAHDATRPFRVIVGNSEIRDLATEFDVYRKSNGSVVVTVLSGKVAIKELSVGGAQPVWTERLLRQDQQLEYTQASLISDVHSVSAVAAVRWREGLLVTEHQPFTTVVSELNRYTSKQILVADPRLLSADIRVGGTLGIQDVAAALQRIQHLGPIVVTDTGDSYVLTYKADATSADERSQGSREDPAGRQ